MFFAAGERSSDVVATLKARMLVVEWHSSCARDTSRKAADGTPGGGNQQHFAHRQDLEKDTMRSLLALFLAGPLMVVNCLMFHLEPNNRKCLKEEITKGVLVSGEYEISKQHGQVTDLIVVDNNGHHFYNKENAESGKFAFTTDSYNVYEICVISRQAQRFWQLKCFSMPVFFSIYQQLNLKTIFRGQSDP